MLSLINLTLILQLIIFIVVTVLLLKSKSRILKILGVILLLFVLFSFLDQMERELGVNLF